MTNAELIAELSRYPSHVPVKVLLSEVIPFSPETGSEAPIMLCPEDAIEADTVIYEGAFILIESK